MFSRTHVGAFFLRLIVFNLVFNSFPILNFFFRSGVIKIFREMTSKEEDEEFQTRSEIDNFVGASTFNVITAVIILVPLIFSIFYPKIASILGYVGSVCGLFVIYILPISTYLVKLKYEVDNPIIAEADKMNREYQHKKLYQSKLTEINEMEEN